eukprot:24671-Eustigmatos_ZCMA.PRE.1
MGPPVELPQPTIMVFMRSTSHPDSMQLHHPEQDLHSPQGFPSSPVCRYAVLNQRRAWTLPAGV